MILYTEYKQIYKNTRAKEERGKGETYPTQPIYALPRKPMLAFNALRGYGSVLSFSLSHPSHEVILFLH